MRVKHLVFLLCLPVFFAMIAILLAQPTSVHAQVASNVTVLVDRLNVRSGPGTGYAVVAGVSRGEQYGVVGQSGNCAWLQIAKRGRTLGWVSGSRSYTRLSGACSAIPAASGNAAPAAGGVRQGCALLINQLGSEVKLSVESSNGRQSSWSIPAGGRSKVCVDPGSYTATFTAAGIPGSMAFPVTVKGGEYYEIPLSLPG
jgi:hypothetical protein